MQTVPPTAGPLAACPHCGTRVATPAGPVRFEYGVGVVGNQMCTGCGAHWRYFWQEDRRGRGRSLLRPVLIVLVVAALVAGAIAFVATRGPDYPSAWDARIQPIAARVEALRGLSFKHPVKVNFLPPAAFNRLVATNPKDAEEHRAEVERAGALLRSLGLLGAHVDLAQEVNTTQVAGTLAFYDEATKEVFVRGTVPLSVDTRVTLAHELTHVLQDQVFDLGKLRGRAEKSDSGSADAFTALVEGDASRVQALYLAGLPQADRDAYVLQSLRASNDAKRRTVTVPAVVETYFDAPYIFGTPVTRVLTAEGGNASVDAALRGPAPSTRIYLDPGAVKHTPKIPPVPDLLDGEKKLPSVSDGDDHFDSFTFYLMLAARLDLSTALQAADAFASGSQVAYTRGNTTCFRVAVNGVSRASSTYLLSVIGRWARTMPDASASFTATGVAFHSCDPGASAVTPSDTRIRQAVQVAAARDDLVATLARQPLPTGLAVCAARLLVQQPDFRAAIIDGTGLAQPTPRMVRESADAGVRCKADPNSGLP